MSGIGADGLGNWHLIENLISVNRTLSSNYAFCGKDGEEYDDTFVGAFTSMDCDHHWRIWYEVTCTPQRSNWYPPHVFFNNRVVMGVACYVLIYSMKEGKKVFVVALGVDYTLNNIKTFLVITYYNSYLSELVFEEAEPNYVLGLSPGSMVANTVLKYNNTVPCQDVNSDKCTYACLHILQLLEDPMDIILSKVFVKQKEA